MKNDDRRRHWGILFRIVAVVFISSCFIIPVTVSGQRIQPSTRVPYSVNFISIGAGTDHKAEEKFQEYLKTFEKNQKVKLDYKIKPWGKEGESEYVFDLKKLSTKQRSEFKQSVSTMFKDNKLVKITSSTR